MSNFCIDCKYSGNVHHMYVFRLCNHPTNQNPPDEVTGNIRTIKGLDDFRRQICKGERFEAKVKQPWWKLW